MLTLERIKSLPKDENYYPMAFVLEPINSDNIKDGRVTVDFGNGSVDIWSCGWCDVELKLYEYFIDWLNPTPEENTLWTLETGLEPIETYVYQMEKMMKEVIHVIKI